MYTQFLIEYLIDDIPQFEMSVVDSIELYTNEDKFLISKRETRVWHIAKVKKNWLFEVITW